MRLFNFFNPKKLIFYKHASIAKHRLKMIMISDRNCNVNYLPKLEQEILDVVKRYINIDKDNINIKLGNKNNILSFHIILRP